MTLVAPIEIAQRAQRRAADPAASVWVSASAGSGKTKVLTDRVLALLLAGTPPHKILCLTFTKAAAAEMSNRVNERLASWVTMDEDKLWNELADLHPEAPDRLLLDRARRLFAHVLDAPGGLTISTIHGFCQSLLRRFPLEAGVTPHFTVMDERDAREALASAQELCIAHAHRGDDSALAEALKLLTARVHETHFADLMDSLAGCRNKLARMFEAHGGLANVSKALRKKLGLPEDATELSLVTEACRDAAFESAALKRACGALESGTATDKERAALLRAWLAAGDDRGAQFDIYKTVFLTLKDEPLARLATKGAVAALPEILDILETEARRVQAVRALCKAARVAANTEALLRLGARMLDLYAEEKSRRGLLDYDDLIQKSRKLVERDGAAAWVLYKLDGGLDHILIDEAQDTNPDQWAIVDALTREFFAGEGARDIAPLTRTVFAVGDRKQSIYGFQGAAPDEFERMRLLMAARVEAVNMRWDAPTLNVSFRSVKAVLDAVDHVFLNAEAAAGVTDGQEDVGHIPARDLDGGLVELWAPNEPEATDEVLPWMPPVERKRGDSPPARLAALVARRIAHMVTSGEMLESRGRPIRPGDILVLVRRRTGFVEDLIRQLKTREVPVAGVDRMVLTDQMAVMDLLALGQFLLLPEDDLTLATVLKGPLVDLTEEELFTLAYGREKKRLWEVLSAHAGSTSRFGAAHAVLADLLAKVDYLTPVELYGYVLVAREGRKKLLARLGLDAEDPIDEFMTLALSYQDEHAPSLQGFLHWLSAGDAEIKRDLDSGGGNAVRVITVHGAKGLQAPIVFLPDTMQAPTFQDRLLWTKDEAPLMLWCPAVGEIDPKTQATREALAEGQDREYRRLLYVAMTRAEDRLYVCGWQNKRASTKAATWYDLIKAGLAASPHTEKVTDPFLANDGALRDSEVLRLSSLQVGRPKPERETGARGIAVAAPAWTRKDAPPEAEPPRPLAPSRATLADPPANSPVKDARLRYQRGLIIHRLLQSLPDLPPARRRAAAEAFVARPAWELDTPARADLVRETLAVLENPDFAPLFAPETSRAEVPVTGLLGRFALSGQVDRLAVTEEGVWIIDYKTNRPPPRAAVDVDKAYVYQMAAYRRALQAIYPGRSVQCVLLWTDGPFLLELPAQQMDDLLAASGLI